MRTLSRNNRDQARIGSTVLSAQDRSILLSVHAYPTRTLTCKQGGRANKSPEREKETDCKKNSIKSLGSPTLCDHICLETDLSRTSMPSSLPRCMSTAHHVRNLCAHVSICACRPIHSQPPPHENSVPLFDFLSRRASSPTLLRFARDPDKSCVNSKWHACRNLSRNNQGSSDRVNSPLCPRTAQFCSPSTHTPLVPLNVSKVGEPARVKKERERDCKKKLL